MTTPRPRDWVRDAIERRNGPTNTEEEETTSPVNFDGGTRTTMPAPAPSMSQLIRRARHGDVAGLYHPDDAA